MKLNDKILKYISDYMSGDEKVEFERELNESQELRDELQNYKSYLQELKSTPVEDSFYFNNLLPRVKEKIAGRVRHRIPLLPKLAAGAALVVVLFLIINPFGKSSRTNFEQILLNSSDAYQDEILSSIEETNPGALPEEVLKNTDNLINTNLSSELELNDLNVENEYTKTSYLLENLNETEANEIYNQLVNKKIL